MENEAAAWRMNLLSQGRQHCGQVEGGDFKVERGILAYLPVEGDLVLIQESGELLNIGVCL